MNFPETEMDKVYSTLNHWNELAKLSFEEKFYALKKEGKLPEWIDFDTYKQKYASWQNQNGFYKPHTLEEILNQKL